MLGREAAKLVKQYLRCVQDAGIPIAKGVVYGSYARNEQRRDSDIDLLVISPLFDRKKGTAVFDLLWTLRRSTNYRVEPIPVGVKEFRDRKGSAILAAARSEGIVVSI